MVLSLFSRKSNRSADTDNRRRMAGQHGNYEPSEITELESDPLKRCLQLEQYGVILANRERCMNHPQGQAIYQAALARTDEHFALVPEGFVSLAQTINDVPGCPEVDIETAPFLLARYAVTNAQYQHFVDAGGYGDLELWPKEIWPHMIDFRDLSGCAGPRFWEKGRYDKSLADHPVVGICFYEAQAYARWAGFRLPTEAEWQMAASWRIRSSAQILHRYPWGDALDVRRCNLWATGIGGTVPVHEFETGAAPNGVHQLVGNVWEWCDSDFSPIDAKGRPIVGDMLMKSIRGGAFDTYFPCQATSFFRTGLACILRVHNVGFRLAMDIEKPVETSNQE